MLKTFLNCLLILICAKPVFAQNAKLKKPFSVIDEQYLKREVLDCFGFDSHLKVSYSTVELYNSKLKGDKPASIKEINELKSKLKGDAGDAQIYLDISGNYSRLKLYEEADENRKKAIGLVETVLAQHPDSAEAYLFLGGVYMGATNINESLKYYNKSWALKPELVDAPFFISTLFLMTGQLDSALYTINKQLKLFPDNKSFYRILPLYYLYNVIDKLQKKGSDLNAFSIDSITYMPIIENYSNRHKDDFDAEYLYRIAKQVLISTIIPLRTIEDSTFSAANVKFKLKDDEIKFLADSKLFFESCLKKKDVAYHFYANKLIASICILQNEPKKAIPYFKKTIELRPKNICSLTCNTDEDYDNLISVYAIMRDTAEVEKHMLEKIAAQPAIDPKTDDYTDLACLYISKNKFSQARVQFEKALVIEPNNVAALLGMGVLDYVDGNDKSAMKYVDKVYSLDNKKWELFMLYGAILLKQNDVTNAYEAFKILQKIHNREWIKKEILEHFFEEK